MSDDLEKRLRAAYRLHPGMLYREAADELARLRLQLISASEAEEDAKRLRSENEALKEAMADEAHASRWSGGYAFSAKVTKRAAEILAAERKESGNG